MSPTRRAEPIATYEDGDSVVGYALLTKKELRQDKNGRDYLDLQLTDATSAITGKVWSDSRALKGDYEAHDFVAFKGHVNSYRDQLQLNVKECRRVTEEDREHGFDESKLIPSTHEDIAELWRRLEELLDRGIERPVLRRLAGETLETWGPALREHPAAKMIHHAYRGGLLEHVVSMAELADALCSHYEELDRDLVLLGVLFHDLGKIRELGAMPANDYTTEGRLVGHVVIGWDMVRERCAAIPDFPDDLRLHLEHLVLSHQGRKEFGTPIEPMTAEAFALHFVDDLDSKLAQLRRAKETGPPMQFLRGLGRYVYLDLEAENDGSAAEPEDAASDEAPGEEPEDETQPKLEL